MNSKGYAFGKMNFILIAISMVIVIVGFVMMTGAESTDKAFDPEVFSSMRVKVAPIVCLVGFLSVIGGILYSPKSQCKCANETAAETASTNEAITEETKE